jgi:hypothetical protein
LDTNEVVFSQSKKWGQIAHHNISQFHADRSACNEFHLGAETFLVSLKDLKVEEVVKNGKFKVSAGGKSAEGPRQIE